VLWALKAQANFRPLILMSFITFNNEADLEKITNKTAGVLLETIQGGAGFIQPHNNFLKKVRALYGSRCLDDFR
jgi:acetylornithine/succinyldiaminopimelate/putrescine aminotransferase